jgi:hypothetical protein
MPLILRSLVGASAIVLLTGAASVVADPLKEATLTQVVNQVDIVTPARQTSRARSGAAFRAPNSLRTGSASRAELTASDQTVTRVGANTVFRFGEEPRTIYLDQGNVLFYSPTGKGGGTIQTAGASAGVLGSTYIVSATRVGGSKILSLEHRTRVNFKGFIRVLNPGQLTFVLPGMRGKPGVFEFRLRDLVASSELINGFRNQLPSLPAIQANIAKQEREIAKGSKQATEQLIGEATDQGIELYDANARQIFFVEAGASNIFSLFETDLILRTPTIPDEFVLETEDDIRLFLDGLTGFPAEFAQAVLSDADLPNSFAFVAARDIFIETPIVNLSRFQDQDLVVFFATRDITFDFPQSSSSSSSDQGFVNFGGELAFLAAGNILITPNTSVHFDGQALIFESGGSFTVSQGSVFSSGEIDVNALGSVNITDSTISSGNDIFMSSDSINSINVVGSSVVAQADIEFQSFNGSITIDDSIVANSSAQNGFLGIQTENGNDINIVNGSLIAASPTGGQIFISALGGTLNIAGSISQNITAQSISLQARTVILENVFLSGQNVNIGSELGTLALGYSPNNAMGAPNEVGRVNVRGNVHLNGSLVSGSPGGTLLTNGSDVINIFSAQ